MLTVLNQVFFFFLFFYNFVFLDLRRPTVVGLKATSFNSCCQRISSAEILWQFGPPLSTFSFHNAPNILNVKHVWAGYLGTVILLLRSRAAVMRTDCGLVLFCQPSQKRISKRNFRFWSVRPQDSSPTSPQSILKAICLHLLYRCGTQSTLLCFLPIVFSFYDRVFILWM